MSDTANTSDAVTAKWYEWFYHHSDFGPADGDVRGYLADQFEDETGLSLPPEIREAI